VVLVGAPRALRGLRLGARCVAARGATSCGGCRGGARCRRDERLLSRKFGLLVPQHVDGPLEVLQVLEGLVHGREAQVRHDVQAAQRRQDG